MSNIFNRKNKTDRVCTKPQSDLQHLNSTVMFAVNFRIQKCHLPKELIKSPRTWNISNQIDTLQAALKESILADYEFTKEHILAMRVRREANK